jgi:ferredoxin
MKPMNISLWPDTAIISVADCIKCDYCISRCPAGAIQFLHGSEVYWVNQEICHNFPKEECHWICIDICPVMAISKRPT